MEKNEVEMVARVNARAQKNFRTIAELTEKALKRGDKEITTKADEEKHD